LNAATYRKREREREREGRGMGRGRGRGRREERQSLVKGKLKLSMREVSATLIAPKCNATNLNIAGFITTLRATYNFYERVGTTKGRSGRRFGTSSASITEGRQKLVSIWTTN
jgi:hypothetical protein